MRDSYCCVVWSGNKQIGESLSLEQLGRLRHVVPGFGIRRIPYVVETLLHVAGIRYRTAAVLPSFTLVLEAIVGTEQLAVVPRVLAEIRGIRLPLRILPCPVDLPPMIEMLQLSNHRDRDPLLG